MSGPLFLSSDSEKNRSTEKTFEISSISKTLHIPKDVTHLVIKENACASCKPIERLVFLNKLMNSIPRESAKNITLTLESGSLHSDQGQDPKTLGMFLQGICCHGWSQVILEPSILSPKNPSSATVVLASDEISNVFINSSSVPNVRGTMVIDIDLSKTEITDIDHLARTLDSYNAIVREKLFTAGDLTVRIRHPEGWLIEGKIPSEDAAVKDQSATIKKLLSSLIVQEYGSSYRDRFIDQIADIMQPTDDPGFNEPGLGGLVFGYQSEEDIIDSFLHPTRDTHSPGPRPS